jgi:recombination protein RecT
MAQEVITYQDFEGELEQRAESFAALLPANVDHGKFRANAVAAVRQTPTLLKCTKRSLFGAITRSAQDGLMPDGREGVINVYKTKQPNGSWQETAQWIPMTHGIRKRAKEIDGIIVDAQVVHANDHFHYRRGDDPRIDHVPASLGTPRGEMVGAYAIFKSRDGAILHREVMDAEQIERVRSQSKQPDGLMWSKFTEEAWRKTVIRRGFKSVPCSEQLQEVVRRDDDAFDFASENGAGPRRQPARVVQAPARGERRPPPPLVGGGRAEPGRHVPLDVDDVDTAEVEGSSEVTDVPHDPATGELAPDAGPKITAGLDDWFAKVNSGATRAGSLADLDDYWEAEVAPHRRTLIPPDQDALDNLYGRHRKRLVG